MSAARAPGSGSCHYGRRQPAGAFAAPAETAISVRLSPAGQVGTDVDYSPAIIMSEAPASPVFPAAQEAGPTLLVVDDEPGIVDSLQKVFEREGLRVLTAGAGLSALEIMRREPVSVLLTD